MNWFPFQVKSNLLAGFYLCLCLAFYFALPKPLFKSPYSKVIYAEGQQLLGARIASDGQWRFPMSTVIPHRFEKAIITYEDQRFYKHPGVDPKSIVRATLRNWQAGKIEEGASTLSMQVIRLARQGKPRTLFQKLIETLLAIRLELSYSKAEILALYAGAAPFGGNVVGLETAAWRYYGKAAEQLSWAEAATLAVLPNAPGMIHPGRNRKQLRIKRDALLSRLAQQGYLDEYGVQLAKAEKLPAAPLPLPQLATHLLTFPDKKDTPRFTSTIDYHLQRNVQDILQQHQSRLSANQIHNAAVVVLDVDTKAVKAYLGNMPNAGNQHQAQVDCAQAARSTGSILKPFLYAHALDAGTLLPSAILSDIPTHINGYRPENYHRAYDGIVPANVALAKSLNIPMVRLLQAYGLDKFHFNLQQLGLSTINRSADNYGLTLILGGAEASLWQLSQVYASLAKELKVFNSTNSLYSVNAWQTPQWQLPIDTVERYQAQYSKLSAGAIWSTFKAMQEVSRPDQSGRWENFNSGVPIAWKTGTSFGFRDAWAIGISDNYVVGVWVGNADGEGRPQCVGTKAAAPILFDVFRLLRPRNILGEIPWDDLSQIAICKNSGYRAGNHCPRDSALVPIGSLKAAACSFHQPILLDESKRFRVHPNCYSLQQAVDSNWLVLLPIESAYYRKKNPGYSGLPAWKAGCEESTALAQLDLIYPRRNAKVRVPRDVDGQLSKVVFEAAHVQEAANIAWYLDDEALGTTALFHYQAIAPSIGMHRLVLVDQWGERIERIFEIVDQ